MITGELRSKVDKIWETFWTGGITNPLEVIEQFTYLLFIKGLDDKEIIKENDAILLGIDFDRTFPEDKQNLRWSKFKNFEAETMYEIVANEVFPFIKNLHTNKDSAYAKYMGDAIFKVPTPLMLSKIVDGIDNIDMDENKEYVILGKGVGFGKKVSQRFDKPEGCTTYRLEQETERGSAKELVKGIEPEYLEIADAILTESQKVFGDSIDRGILFPLADHISFAVARIRRNEQISNPLTEDIKVLFYSEFKVAETLKTILRERLQIEIDDHEVGYVALHIHSAIGDEKVSVAMQTARAVRECIDMIEKATGKPIDVLSLSYNRLMNHMKYMVARASTGEKLNLDMNEYMLDQYPQAYKVATDICKNLEGCIGHKLDETETGYLAMHIQRVYKDAV